MNLQSRAAGDALTAMPTLTDRRGPVADRQARRARALTVASGRYLIASLLLLAPCYWQSRIQAGDLSSHIYNAWLARMIEDGRAPGLAVVGQSTNVLFDLILAALFRLVGPGAAQRVAVSVAVLVFVWGAFAFVAAVAGRKPWNLLPCLAMLAYGWVFHVGFFNFYLSFGVCLGAMALVWNAGARRIPAALLLLACAYSAHVLPVLWALGLGGYAAIARAVPARRRAILTCLVVVGLVAVQFLSRRFFHGTWSVGQLFIGTGAEQVWVFGDKYCVAFAGVLMVWGMLLRTLVHERGLRAILSAVPFHLCVIAGGAAVLLPERVLLPGYAHALAGIPERLSLGVAICICALAGSAAPRRIQQVALVGVMAVFFCFLYLDERAINAFEDRMQAAVSSLQPGDRVLSFLLDDGTRNNPISHVIDRVCIGRCYSYANYEPSTRQFRIRVLAPNPVVTALYGDSFRMQTGGYTVQDRDLPLWAVDIGPAGQMFLKPLRKGETTTVTRWDTPRNRPYPQP